MYVHVKDIIAKCTSKSEGLALYEAIKPELELGDNIMIDFHGITNITTDFLNGFSGTALESFTKDTLKQIRYVRTATYIKRRISAYLA